MIPSQGPEVGRQDAGQLTSPALRARRPGCFGCQVQPRWGAASAAGESCQRSQGSEGRCPELPSQEHAWTNCLPEHTGRAHRQSIQSTQSTQSRAGNYIQACSAVVQLSVQCRAWTASQPARERKGSAGAAQQHSTQHAEQHAACNAARSMQSRQGQHAAWQCSTQHEFCRADRAGPGGQNGGAKN